MTLRVDPKDIVTETTNKYVEVYICPTPGCTSYTAVPLGGPKLEDQWTGPKTENQQSLQKATGSPFTHNRAECPDCRQRGVKVQRIRLKTVVPVPKVGPPTPPNPSSLGAGMGSAAA